jgi:prefoldin subunit 5
MNIKKLELKEIDKLENEIRSTITSLKTHVDMLNEIMDNYNPSNDRFLSFYYDELKEAVELVNKKSADLVASNFKMEAIIEKIEREKLGHLFGAAYE